MFAVIGSVLIFISAIAIADRLLDGVDASIRGVSAVRVILERTKVLIECYALPADEILKRIDASLFADCGYAGEAPKSFAELAEGAKITEFEGGITSGLNDDGVQDGMQVYRIVIISDEKHDEVLEIPYANITSLRFEDEYKQLSFRKNSFRTKVSTLIIEDSDGKSLCLPMHSSVETDTFVERINELITENK